MGGLSPLSVISGIQQIGSLTGVSSPVLGSLGTIFEAITGTSEAQEEERRRQALVANQDLALAQLEQTQRLQEAQDARASEQAKQKIAADAAAAERQRRAALKRAMAKQTALFGASGIASGGGSAQAVLLGLFDESDEERQEREKLDTLKVNALNSDLADSKSINVLQRAQLMQQQELDRATRF